METITEINNKNNDLVSYINPIAFYNFDYQNTKLINNHLISAGITFLNTNSTDLKSPIFQIVLDNNLHYLEQEKKQSYKAILENNNGITYLKLIYYTKNGGLSKRFNSKKALQELLLPKNNAIETAKRKMKEEIEAEAKDKTRKIGKKRNKRKNRVKNRSHSKSPNSKKSTKAAKKKYRLKFASKIKNAKTNLANTHTGLAAKENTTPNVMQIADTEPKTKSQSKIKICTLAQTKYKAHALAKTLANTMTKIATLQQLLILSTDWILTKTLLNALATQLKIADIQQQRLESAQVLALTLYLNRALAKLVIKKITLASILNNTLSKMYSLIKLAFDLKNLKLSEKLSHAIATLANVAKKQKQELTTLEPLIAITNKTHTFINTHPLYAADLLGTLIATGANSINLPQILQAYFAPPANIPNVPSPLALPDLISQLSQKSANLELLELIDQGEDDASINQQLPPISAIELADLYAEEYYNPNLQERSKVPTQSFFTWATSSENTFLINDYLINAGIDFINDEAQDLSYPLNSLRIDGHWYYLDRQKKQGYIAKLEATAQGFPKLSLTYHNFRQGGVSIAFDSFHALQLLWTEIKGSQPLKEFKRRIKKPSSKAKAIVNKIAEAVDFITPEKELWDSLALTGQSTYLERKGLGSFNLPGLRFGQDYIAVAIINSAGLFQGTQIIYNDGSKRFSKGLKKKGNFAIIGAATLPAKIRSIRICEGLATAASIYAATGEPVFVALDAGNLLAAGKSLRNIYPKAPIIFYADNDWQKADQILPNGKILGNTGLKAANHAAVKLRNARVATPDFTSFDPLTTAATTDFNDLHLLAGLAAIKNTNTHKPDLALALSVKLAKAQAKVHGVLSANNFKNGRKFNYEARFLPQISFNNGVHLIRSAIGSGKTEVVADFVKTNPHISVLHITHLVALVESAAARFNLTSYQDCDQLDFYNEKRLAICLNSLPKLFSLKIEQSFDVVIIDEVEQLYMRLTSDIKQKPLVFTILQHLMKSAKTLICLDAHLSEITVNMINEICPDKEIYTHINDYKSEEPRTIKFYENAESVQMQAMATLAKNQSVYLNCNSKQEAAKTFKTIEANFPGKKGLYISGDNNGDHEVCAFFKDVNKESLKYDYIISTPAVATGVSIDNDHFNFVGGVFSAQITTFNDCMQSLGRVRKANILHVYCELRRAFLPLDEETITAKWTHTHAYDLNLMQLDAETSKQVILNPLYEKLLTLVTQQRNRSFNDFFVEFSLLAMTENFNLTYSEDNLDEEQRKNLKAFKKAAILEEKNEELILTLEQLQALANKPRKTLAETNAYKKQKTIEFFNLEPTDRDTVNEIVQLNKNNRLRLQLENMELAIGSIELATARFKAQLNDGERFAADLNYYAITQKLFQKLLKFLEVRHTNSGLSINDFRYSKETIIESGFLKWIDENRKVLQGIINIPSLEHLESAPLRFISKLLGKIGLKQKRVGRAAKGVYQLDAERISFLNSLLKRRQAGIVGKAMPLVVPVTKKLDFKEIFKECLQKIKDLFSPPLLPELSPI